MTIYALSSNMDPHQCSLACLAQAIKKPTTIPDRAHEKHSICLCAYFRYSGIWIHVYVLQHCCIVFAGTNCFLQPVPKQRKRLPMQVSITQTGKTENIPFEYEDKGYAQAITSKKRRESSWITVCALWVNKTFLFFSNVSQKGCSTASYKKLRFTWNKLPTPEWTCE